MSSWVNGRFSGQQPESFINTMSFSLLSSCPVNFNVPPQPTRPNWQYTQLRVTFTEVAFGSGVGTVTVIGFNPLQHSYVNLRILGAIVSTPFWSWW